jgi:hypothetical protein
MRVGKGLLVLFGAVLALNMFGRPEKSEPLLKESAAVSASTIRTAFDQAEERRRNAIAEHQAVVESLRLVKVGWHLDGFGNVLMASFTVRNEGKRNMKDLQIACDMYSNSGTRIGGATATIYEWLNAGKTRTFPAMNLGFVNSQSAKMGCRIVEAAEL